MFKLSKDGTGNYTIHTVLKSFTDSDGANPYASLMEASDGAVYGTTFRGSNTRGTVFKLSKDGNGNYTIHTVLKNFTGTDGFYPYAALVEGSDGVLYGTTYQGGSNNYGTVFKLSKDGTGNYTIHTALKSFTGSDGAYPYAGLLAGSDGALYGTTASGGSSVYGTVFKMSKDGSGNYTVHTVLKNFTGADGANPPAGLVEGSDGALYGTTANGGSSGYGTVFRLSTNGSGNYIVHTVLKSFTGSDGANPYAGLVEANDGALYGTTYYGGSSGNGTVFRIGCVSSGWSFDAPTAVDNCSGTNVAITIVSTITNGPCQQFITRTWLATDLCGNTSTCSQTVTLTNSVCTPPAFTQFAYNGNIFSLSFQTLCGFNYQVQYKNALTDPAWTPLPAVSGTGGIVTVQDTPTPQQMRFYRVACLEP